MTIFDNASSITINNKTVTAIEINGVGAFYTTNSQNTVNIKVTVKDAQSNNAIEGATVTIGEVTGTTGSAGGCTLRDVLTGEQTVTISHELYEPFSQTLTVRVDSTSETFKISPHEGK